MKSQQELRSGLDTNVKVRDITTQYPEIDGVIQHISVETNRNFDFRGYITDLESLGIPAENIGISFCG